MAEISRKVIKMDNIELLSNTGYVQYNKTIAKSLGINVAIMIGELFAEYQYWKREGKLENGWFFSSAENVEDNTALSKFQQGEAIKVLTDLNLIEKQVRRLDSNKFKQIRFFRINKANIDKFIEDCKGVTIGSQETELPEGEKLNYPQSNNLTTEGQEIELPDVKKLDTKNNNNNNNCKENNNKNKEIDKLDKSVNIPFLESLNLKNLNLNLTESRIKEVYEFIDRKRKQIDLTGLQNWEILKYMDDSKEAYKLGKSNHRVPNDLTQRIKETKEKYPQIDQMVYELSHSMWI